MSRPEALEARSGCYSSRPVRGSVGADVRFEILSRFELTVQMLDRQTMS